MERVVVFDLTMAVDVVPVPIIAPSAIEELNSVELQKYVVQNSSITEGAGT